MDAIDSQEDELRKMYKVERRFNKGRVSRFFLAPLRNALYILAKAMNCSVPVSIKLGSGYIFRGLLTEAVTGVIWRYRLFDIGSTISFMREIPRNGVVIDVGAHFGYFSLLSCHCVGEDGKVVSVEAMPSTFDCLKRNVDSNALGDRCEIINCAAFNANDCVMEFTDYGPELSSLNSAFGSRNPKLTTGKETRKVKVRTVTIDSLVKQKQLERVDFVKIDAESSEYVVLEGMTEVLEKFRPKVIIELGDNEIEGAEMKTSEIIEFVEKFGYQAMYRDGQELKPLPKLALYDYCNVLFIPVD